MDEQTGVKPAEPRFEHGHFLLIAGLGGRFTQQTTQGDLPEKYRWVEVLPQHYAVFEHKGTLDQLPATFQYIWKTWLPQSGHQAADAPEFERYSEDFNPKLNTGVLEIWLPLKDK
jgi:AraC family transcriptional regulator